MATKAKKSVSSTDTKKKVSKKKTAAKKTSSKKKTTAAKNSTNKTTKKTSTHPNKIHRAATTKLNVSAEERWRMVAITAYHKAEARGFAPGDEAMDWFEAEKEVDALLLSKK